MALCFVSVGSNIERETNVRGALAAMHEAFGPLLISSVYETPAVGFDGAPFYNLVVAFVTDTAPQQVAQQLREIEIQHGRRRGEARFAPRTLDLDLLLYGDRIVDEHGLLLPRPDIEQHAFVLEPLAEIAPDLRHPQRQRSYALMWRALGEQVPGRKVRFELGA